MYLSRLILNMRHRAVRRDLADCQQMHRTVMSGFLGREAAHDPRATLGVLYRVEIHPRTGVPALLVQSVVPPDWSGLEDGYLLNMGGDPENPACKPVGESYAAIATGATLVFRLRANPTRKIDTKSGPNGDRRNGRRVELRGEGAQVEWLRRKGEEAGFRLISVRAAPGVPNLRAVPSDKTVGRREGKGVTFGAVLFEGELQVADADRFKKCLESGVGPGKAYGFGLLSVAPARE